MARKVIVVVPTLNEEENIGSLIAAILLQNLEILVADSHSSDQTPDIIKVLSQKDKRIHYLDVQKRGLGLSLSEGINYAFNNLNADVVVTMEADLSCDPELLPQFIKKIEKYDVVIGSRYVRGGAIANWSWWRRTLSLVANFILRVLAGMPNLREFTNLYRAFTKEVWQEIGAKVSVHKDWLFVPAFAFELLNTNFKFVEQPIIYHDRFGGRSKMKTISYTVDLLRYALRFRSRKIFSLLRK